MRPYYVHVLSVVWYNRKYIVKLSIEYRYIQYRYIQRGILSILFDDLLPTRRGSIQNSEPVENWTIALYIRGATGGGRGRTGVAVTSFGEPGELGEVATFALVELVDVDCSKRRVQVILYTVRYPLYYSKSQYSPWLDLAHYKAAYWCVDHQVACRCYVSHTLSPVAFISFFLSDFYNVLPPVSCLIATSPARPESTFPPLRSVMIPDAFALWRQRRFQFWSTWSLPISITVHRHFQDITQSIGKRSLQANNFH